MQARSAILSELRPEGIIRRVVRDSGRSAVLKSARDTRTLRLPDTRSPPGAADRSGATGCRAPTRTLAPVEQATPNKTVAAISLVCLMRFLAASNDRHEQRCNRCRSPHTRYARPVHEYDSHAVRAHRSAGVMSSKRAPRAYCTMVSAIPWSNRYVLTPMM